MKWDEFFSWEQASRDSIDVKKIYIDMAGDLVTGVLLSQIVYWFLPGRSGESKLHVEKDGVIWLAKKMDDWWDECRVSAKQARRAIAALKARGIIETRICKFAGVPTTHIRLTDRFLDLLTQASTVRANPLCPKVQMDYAQRYKSIMPKGMNPLQRLLQRPPQRLLQKICPMLAHRVRPRLRRIYRHHAPCLQRWPGYVR